MPRCLLLHLFFAPMISNCVSIIFSNEYKKRATSYEVARPCGAGSRGRTDTVLLPSDFESDASANSTIPANGATLGRRKYYIIKKGKNQYVSKKNIPTQNICFSLLKFK